jgi:hypothetical protein
MHASLDTVLISDEGDRVTKGEDSNTRSRAAGLTTGGLCLPLALLVATWAATLAWLAWVTG